MDRQLQATEAVAHLVAVGDRMAKSLSIKIHLLLTYDLRVPADERRSYHRSSREMWKPFCGTEGNDTVTVK